MRAIKYKAWDIANERWLNLASIVISITGGVIGVYDMDNELYGSHQIDLVQFTGLSDKSGKDIYEGDIVRGDLHGGHWVSFVSFKDYGGFNIKPVRRIMNDGEDCGRVYNWAAHGKGGGEMSVEVIGNVRENPELLEAKP